MATASGAASDTDIPEQHTARGTTPLATLALGALGVVYGDIGTSPLYTMKEVFGGAHHPVAITTSNVLGVLSLVFWSLIAIVTIKYVLFVTRADNRGEGGTLALTALARGAARSPRTRYFVVLLGLAAAALFYGDGVITPAISVLSAVEGLEVVTPALKPYVIPITLAVLVALFAVQSRGTGRVSVLFGPIMLAWFATLAVLGVVNIARAPEVLAALGPWHAASFVAEAPSRAFLALGAIVLCVTGAEALYADMGHFGRRPIVLAWVALVLPALALNYFGQGALLLADPSAIVHPFYRLVPEWGLVPLVILATAATVIASQALISGAFSVTQQAIQLGFAPRFVIRHTSAREIGQIYAPGVNWILCALVAGTVVGFGSSSNLAAAYGVAVTLDMVITAILFGVVAHLLWKWSIAKTVAIVGAFLVVDVAYLAANLTKVAAGGWFPLVFGAIVFTLLATWRRGRELLHEASGDGGIPLEPFVKSLAASSSVVHVPGTAVFLTTNCDCVPSAFLHNLKHNRVVHERNVVLSVFNLEQPRVPDSQRVVVESLGHGFHRVKVFYGFMESPDLPAALDWTTEQGLEVTVNDASFFLGRETLVPRVGAGLAGWRARLFAAMYRNSGSAAVFFKLPANRVVELGAQVTL
jgi:KUP system potassium uptake protein